MMKSKITPQNKVICDDCSGEFELRIEETEIEPGIIEQYFECPYCGARTTITITDLEMRNMIKRRKRLRKDYAKALKNHARLEETTAILQADSNLKAELFRASARMKEKYHRGDEEDENQGG